MYARRRPNGCPSPSGNYPVKPDSPFITVHSLSRRAERHGALQVVATKGAGNGGVPHMRINWLGTAAIALIIGTGSAFAQQSDLPQKLPSAPRAASSGRLAP